MITYYQETDSRVVVPLPEVTYPVSWRPSHETTGSLSSRNHILDPEESALFRNAWRLIRNLRASEQVKEAKRLLQTIQSTVDTFQKSRFDLGSLPPLNAHAPPDGSIYFEWTTREFRVGFSIEPNQAESGWYLVSTPKLGEISAAGYLAGIDAKHLVVWLLSFVLSNA